MISRIFEWLMEAYLSWRVERSLKKGSPDTPLTEQEFKRLQDLLKLQQKRGTE